jgi:hypothetical protein
MVNLILAYGVIAVFLIGYIASILVRTRRINRALRDDGVQSNK